MKNLIGFVIPIILLLFVAILTKPTDRECLQEISGHNLGDNVFNDLFTGSGADRLLYRVEDHVIYKTITNKITGQEVGYTFFWAVVIN